MNGVLSQPRPLSFEGVAVSVSFNSFRRHLIWQSQFPLACKRKSASPITVRSVRAVTSNSRLIVRCSTRTWTASIRRLPTPSLRVGKRLTTNWLNNPGIHLHSQVMASLMEYPITPDTPDTARVVMSLEPQKVKFGRFTRLPGGNRSIRKVWYRNGFTGNRLEDLSIREASSLIDELKSAQTGVSR